MISEDHKEKRDKLKQRVKDIRRSEREAKEQSREVYKKDTEELRRTNDRARGVKN